MSDREKITNYICHSYRFLYNKLPLRMTNRGGNSLTFCLLETNWFIISNKQERS
jgi:hypothetical protein